MPFDGERFAQNIVDTIVQKRVIEPSEKVYRDAKINLSNTMVNVQTGNLRSNLSMSKNVSKRAATVEIKSDTPYSRFVHDGTKPHTILPKDPAGVLRFQVGGRTVFSKRVQHPGTKARPFLVKALSKHFRSVR